MKTDVLDLVDVLGSDLVNPTMADRYYDEAVFALTDVQLTVQVTLIPVTSGTATYAIPGNAVRVLAAFFGLKELTRTTLGSLDDQSRSWRGTTGQPVSYVEEHEPQRQVRLYPTPNVTSSGVPFPAPFGEDYPTNYLVLVTTDRTDPAPWLDFPLALSILQREFSRESDHRDTVFADLCAKLAQIYRSVGGPP